MRTLSRSTLIALAAASALASAACNTIAGAGRDLESAGEAVQDVADEAHEESRENKAN